MIGIGGPIGLPTKGSYTSERKRHLTLVNIICGTWPGDPLKLAPLPHNRTRRSDHHCRALLIELGLRDRVELPMQLGELSVSFGIGLLIGRCRIGENRA